MTVLRPRAAVLGSPVGHSLSPALHLAAYAACGLDWDYQAIECDESGLATLLDGVRRNPAWRGLSLTMPLKLAALPLVDEVSDDVRIVGALNTVVVTASDPNARLSGHNTDIEGVARAIRETGMDAPIRPLVLGAGGTARAAIAALGRLGAPVATVAARDRSRAAALAAVGDRAGVQVVPLGWDDVPNALDAADLVVATTPKGATDPLCARGWPRGVPLVDVLYDPWPTPLALRAARDGARVAGGMAVLAFQAAAQFVLMTGLAAPIEVIRSAGERALAERTAPDER